MKNLLFYMEFANNQQAFLRKISNNYIFLVQGNEIVKFFTIRFYSVN